MEHIDRPDYILYTHEDYGYQFYEVIEDGADVDGIESFNFAVTTDTFFEVILIERGAGESESIIEDWGLTVQNAIAKDSIRILLLRY